MIWKTVKITNDKKGKTTPYASVGFGKITLNTAACELIENYEDYQYAELLTGYENNKLHIGIKLLKEISVDSVKLSKRFYKGKIRSFTIDNKLVVEDLFSINGTQQKVTRYTVLKDKDADNILMIVGV